MAGEAECAIGAPSKPVRMRPGRFELGFADFIVWLPVAAARAGEIPDRGWHDDSGSPI
jgi:hypothetical protein